MLTYALVSLRQPGHSDSPESAFDHTYQQILNAPEEEDQIEISEDGDDENEEEDQLMESKDEDNGNLHIHVIDIFLTAHIRSP